MESISIHITRHDLLTTSMNNTGTILEQLFELLVCRFMSFVSTEVLESVGGKQKSQGHGSNATEIMGQRVGDYYG